jgi:Na+-driven multidrug efflux pump
MFGDINMLFIFGPAMIFAGTFAFVSRKRIRQQNTTEIRKAINYFKVVSITFGSLVLVLFLLLPSTPSLSTFGYPDGTAEINNQQKLLHLLQEYNKAIVRTTEVVFWFLFLFIWWFLTALYAVAKSFSDTSADSFGSPGAD